VKEQQVRNAKGRTDKDSLRQTFVGLRIKKARQRNGAANRKKANSFRAGLPDGLFSNQKSQFGYILGVLQWKILEYFMTIWSILRPFGNISWPFGIFCGHLVYFSPFWYFVPRKIWQPCFRVQTMQKNLFLENRFAASISKLLSFPTTTTTL
jgi:hypothetical protein